MPRHARKVLRIVAEYIKIDGQLIQVDPKEVPGLPQRCRDAVISWETGISPKSQVTKGNPEMTNNTLPPTLTVKDVMQYLQLGKTKVDSLIRSGELKSYKIGRSRRIRREALLEYVETLERKG